MASVEWGKYKLCELFAKIDSDKMNYKTSELPSEPTGIFTLPCLTAGIQNQGLNNYVPRENALILKNVITISANGANTGATFYQSKEFTVLQDAYALKWVKTSSTLSDNQHLFLVSTIRKTIFGNYAWTNKAGWERIKNDYIKLPTKNGKIDFEFMESFIEELEAERIEELEAERIEELEAYLSVSGLKDTQLTADELSALDKLKSNKIFWKEYTIDQLFDIVTTAHRFDANKINIIENGRYPYIVRTSNNNGQRGFIDENPIYLNSGNTISFGQDTATIFYQEKPYFTGDKIKILIPKLLNFRKENAQFFISTMNLTFSNFTWGSTRFNVDILKNQIVKIPISSKDKEIDFVFMETLIKAIQKLVIADVVKFSDEKIKATKQVVG